MKERKVHKVSFFSGVVVGAVTATAVIQWLGIWFFGGY